MLLLIFSFFTAALSAGEYVISDDGRQILLNDDGSWVQVSKDRHATTASGQRIRLKPDGSWDVMKKLDSDEAAAHYAISNSGSQHEAIAGNDVGMLLDKVEILKKKTKVLKSVRIDTRTVYHLTIINQSSENIQLDTLPLDAFSANSSGGDVFEVLSATATSELLKPSQRTTLIVVTEGSPKWFGVKYLNIELAKNAIGSSMPRILSKNIDDVIRRTVDKL
jgi:hypothetical protein